MEWLSDPTALAGLATLVVLEIVLGIDNLIFIAILSDKLPPEQRQKARVTGLSLALGMRLALLASIAWMAQLTDTIFTVMGNEISWRDIIMFVGGGFLLFKGTMELHEKLEPDHHKDHGPVVYAGFWAVILQIVILDAVFSLDAVITAVGMTHHIEVAMIAVVIAMVLMIVASKALMDFVSKHPTVVILCLGFLLMIGFSLIVEGFGYHIPKGYLYAAIGFSVIIEALNQLAQRNRRKTFAKIDPRTRMAQAVLGLLGTRTHDTDPNIHHEMSDLAAKPHEQDVFKPQERMMIHRVLQLAEQPVQAIMTPRHDLYWVDLSDERETMIREMHECPYSTLIVADQGKIEEPLGIIQKKDLADLFLEEKGLSGLRSIIRQPVAIPDTMTALQALDMFQKSRIHVAFVIDEYGTLEGLVTLTDVVEAIAGEMPEDHEDDDGFSHEAQADGSIIVNGNLTLQELREILGPLDLPPGDYNTVAGIALNVLRKLPQAGDRFELPGGWFVAIEHMDGRRVSRMRFGRAEAA
jgi:CBS domain containing-hemolysin-like protein